MPNYHNVPVINDLNQIVEMHKKKPIDAHVARTLITKVLNKYSKLGLDNAKMRLAYVLDAQQKAKGTLASMEKLLEELEDPDYIPEIYKLPTLQGGLKVLNLLVDAVTADSTTIYALMGQYRDNWNGTIEKVMGKELDFVNAHIAIRTQTMVLGKQAVAATDRLGEYVKRAEQISKAAEKARAGGERSAQEAKSEADDLLKLIQSAESDSAERLRRSSKKTKSMTVYKKEKVYTGKEHKVVESLFQDLETERKGISGHCKTALQNKVRLDGLAKKSGSLLSGHQGKADAMILNLNNSHAEALKIVTESKDLLLVLAKRIGK